MYLIRFLIQKEIFNNNCNQNLTFYFNYFIFKMKKIKIKNYYKIL